jgi:deoxycytidylate deaminase
MSKELLNIAAKVAHKGSIDRTFKLGCVIKRRDGAIVKSSNNILKVPCHSGHAEVRALKKAGRHAQVLCVARIQRGNGEWAMAKPCKRCQAKIRSMGVKKVIYTISPNEFGIWYP